MNYFDFMEIYQGMQKWHSVKFYTGGQYYQHHEAWMMFEDMIHNPKPIWELNHEDQSVKDFEFNPNLLKIGRAIFDINSDNFELAQYLLKQPTGIYAINPHEDVSNLLDLHIETLESGDMVARVDSNEAILLSLNDPKITIYYHEAP